MISDVSTIDSGAVVPHETKSGSLQPFARGIHGNGFVQPVSAPREYLDARKPQPSFEGEEKLLITLFPDQQQETKDLYYTCCLVQKFVKGGLSVEAACKEAFRVYARKVARYGWTHKTFRTHKYDKWAKAKDWVALVNLAKAPASWKPENRGLPAAFLEYVAQKFGSATREDSKRQAIFAVKKIWRTGRNDRGEEEVIPGYEKGWKDRAREIYPDGWGYDNITRQIKARKKFTDADRALLHEGIAAAKEFLPQHRGTRKGLRFMERVTFDDVRMDWLIFDPETGEPCELWLLVARDTATAMVLGFVIHPSRVRDDGSQSHLGLKEMKQLVAWILERYPLPKEYIVHFVVERGTATLSAGSRLALQELLPHRIQVHYTSMIGGKSARGYEEKAKGNSRGKASHESHNRLFHTQSCPLPGQTGARWDIRPADLDARVKECVEIWELRNRLPEHLRGQEQYPLLTINQAREHLIGYCVDQNFRKEHALEGFEEILEWLDTTGPQPRWRAKGEYDPSLGKVKWNKRPEMPVERAMRLIQGCEWERVSPDVIIAFLRHTERPVEIKNVGGEIKFRTEGRDVLFAPVLNCKVPPVGTQCLAYFNEEDPAFVHVTDGRGVILGTWVRRDRVAARDEAVLQEAFRYTANALAAAKARAEQLAAPERAQLEAMRAHNAELVERGNECIDVAPTPIPDRDSKLQSPIAASLEAAHEQFQQTKAESKRAANAAADAILAPSEISGDTSAGDDLLGALTGE